MGRGTNTAAQLTAQLRPYPQHMQAITIDRARQIAETAHAGTDDLQGVPYIDHVRRVVARLHGDDEKIVAWLHDTVEDTSVTFEQLAAAGVTPTQLAALRLVTRDRDSGLTYMNWIRQLADDDSEAGRIARQVKYADLLDNMSRPQPPGREDIVEKRYKRAQRIIDQAFIRFGEQPPATA